MATARGPETSSAADPGSAASGGPAVDRVESLDWADRWMHDSFRVVQGSGGFALVDVDMTRVTALLARFAEEGVRATFNHVVVRATALALARHPELHVLVAGTRRLRPGRVDIGLSVAGTLNYAPVMVIEDAAAKPVRALAEEVARRIPEVRAKEQVDLAGMRRWGWLIPFGWLRRFIVRRVLESLRLRRQLSGTFQVSCLNVDVVVPLLFNSAALLGVGRVRDRVVAESGAPVVRPIATLSCAIDHKSWDGARAAIFLGELKRILEDEDLDA